MRLVQQTENPLAVTFTDMKGIAMDDFRKVVIPKKHKISHHVPVADLVLNKSGVFDRIELSQDEHGVVSYTVCLDPKITRGQKNFQLPSEQQTQIGALIVEAQEFLASKNPTKCGNGAFHAGCLNNLFAVTKTVDRSVLIGDKAEIGKLYDATMGVLTPMAAKHGGSFEVVDIYDAGETPLHVTEKQYLSEDKVSVGFDLIVFGSCSGCAAFNLTYGQAPKKIATGQTMQARQITQSDKYAPGEALIFK